MQKKTIYLSGPITGTSDYKDRFGAAADKLRKQGYSVISPADLPDGYEYATYIHLCLTLIDTADIVLLLPGWGNSRGAILGRMYADSIGKEIKHYCDAAGVSSGDPRAAVW